jgi:WhiB family redox-sensing transcriptional regulator
VPTDTIAAVPTTTVTGPAAPGGVSLPGALPLPGALGHLVDLSDGWDAGARCRGVDATLFFGPNRFEPKADRLAREARAKALCATCPVLTTCRERALANDELYGVWGGLSETDRRSLATASTGGLRAG